MGMKAPRWPEYYLPSWVTTRTDFEAVSPYISACISHYKDSDAITIWQVENEPLDPSGPHRWAITPHFIKQEVSLVRSIDPSRKIAITVWGNELTKRKCYTTAIELADVVGIDLYPRVPKGILLHGPRDSSDRIQAVCNEVKQHHKELWISELQMEPWGPTRSFLPKHFAENIAYALGFHPDGLFSWGFEWWYHQYMLGNHVYWNNAADYYQSRSN
jgi:hypothetical protein